MWPAIQKDCRTLARACQPCQRSKVSRHSITPVGNFTLPPVLFLHVHIDIVGPIPSSAGFQYCITAVDHFTCWPEDFPIPDITAETVSRALLSGWIVRFGCPQTITTDQGRQFGSQLFHSLAKMCGIHLSRTTSHHPAATGLVERLHRTLKAAIMCHADEQWTYSAYAPPTRRTCSHPRQSSSTVSPCVSPVSSLYQPPLRSRHPPSYSSSAATWTSCDQPQQHAMHPRPHSSTRTSGTQPTCSCGGTPHAAPGATIQRPAQRNCPH